MTRRLHVAGSASQTLTRVEALRWAHTLVCEVVRSHVSAGGTVVTQVGDDPRHAGVPDLRILFDWTVMEVCREAVEHGNASPEKDGRPLVMGICTSSGRARLSAVNEDTLATLRDADAMDVTVLPDRFRTFGALLRQTQAAQGDVLLTIGGGVGVEHLVRLYMDRHNPVVPIDLEIGSSWGDSPDGGVAIAREARSHPEDFIELADGGAAGARLDGLRTDVHGELPPVEVMANRLAGLLADLRPKRAFFIRLLDPNASAFADVEWFFRAVVDPVVQERGLERVEVGTDAQRQGLIDAEIFTELHYASAAIIDMTGKRANCAIELGYALARGHLTLLTARHGERLPFDIDKLPCLFWRRDESSFVLQQRLREHWDKQVRRAPVVPRLPIS